MKSAISQIKQKTKKLQRLMYKMKSGQVPENRLLFWHKYFEIYDQMRELKRNNLSIPNLPKCLLTEEQEKTVKELWLCEQLIKAPDLKSMGRILGIC